MRLLRAAELYEAYLAKSLGSTSRWSDRTLTVIAASRKTTSMMAASLTITSALGLLDTASPSNRRIRDRPTRGRSEALDSDLH